MAERFFKRYTLPPKQYLENCPIIIEAGSLLQDTKTGAVLAQIKFRNIGKDSVTACKVCIRAFGPSGDEVEGKEQFWYMDLNVACGQDFGSKVPVILPEATTSRFTVAITEIVLSSGNVWKHEPAQWQQLPKQESVNQVLPSAELCAQYYLEMGTNRSEYYPVCHDRFFLCTCGAVNDSNADTCHTCNRKRVAVLQMAGQQYLSQRANERLAKEEEDRIAREKAEAERQERERIAAEKRAEQRKKTLKKVRKVASISAVALLVMGIGIAGYWYAVNRFIPNKKHGQAIALYQAGEFEQAKALFESLNGYGYSKDWIVTCEDAILQQQYQKAVELLQEENFVDAKYIFSQLGSYGDSKTKLNECEIAITYQDATNLLESGKYEEAAEAFAEIKQYRDAADLWLQAFYGLGEQKLAAQEWEDATNAFTNAGEYGDAAIQIMEVTYQHAMSLKSAKKYDDAAELFRTIKGYKDVDSLLKNDKNLKFCVGNYVTFGAYPQTKQGKDKTPIEWMILAKQGNKILLISRYALDVKQYNNIFAPVTWDKSSLRSWLNKDFMAKAFTATEKTAIQTMHITPDKNPRYSINSGKATEDKVFLLSIQEAERYFANGAARMCAPTDYAIAKGASTSSNSQVDGKQTCWWWLRSPGNYQKCAANVRNGGAVSYDGHDVDDNDYCVRPALWVDIESGVF